jgi:catechol 2,3-dioxygenase-like lactoylglutathione lyase family enzyme
LANASRWSLSARQGFLVCGLFTAGLFVLCCGTGMSNVPVAALGVAVGLLGPVVIALSSIRANRPDVFGTAHVSQSSLPPTTGVTGYADLHLVVNAHGVHNAVVRIRDANVPVSKWPDVGATLPVLVPNGNPRRLQVLWDQVRGHHDLATDDVSYSPYPVEEDYLEEDYPDDGTDYTQTDYEEYPIDEPVVEQTSVTEPVVVDESPELRAEPLSESATAEPLTGAVAAAEPLTGAVAAAAPAQRRPSPGPRRRVVTSADSVEAVVPVPATAPPPAARLAPPVDEPSEPPSGAVEAKPAAPAAVERGDTVVQTGGILIGSPHPPAPREAATVSAAPTETGVAGDAATIEFAPFEPAPEQPPTATPEPSSPLPRRVPGSTRSGSAQGAIPTPPPADDEEPEPAEPDETAETAEMAKTAKTAEAAGPDRYVASYLSDYPEDVQQGLGGVHNVSVTVIVSDLRRSLTFYRDLLGLTEIDGGMGSAILVSGNARILLRQVADTRPVDRRVVHLNLEVDDVHEAYERLRREGVEFMHAPRVVNQGEQLEQWAATLRDPDGHAIALTHWEVRP